MSCIDEPQYTGTDSVLAAEADDDVHTTLVECEYDGI